MTLRDDVTKMSKMQDLYASINHAINYYGLDVKLNMSDDKLLELIGSEVQRYLGTPLPQTDEITKETAERITLLAKKFCAELGLALDEIVWTPGTTSETRLA